MSFVKIAQFGAGGNLGTPIFDALIASQKFQVTVIGRKTSTFTAPESVKVVKVDYSNHEELVEVLKGQDAVAITLGDPKTLEANSKAIIDAAIDAGVKRIIPSEYGSDLSKPPGSTKPFFAAKNNVKAYLREKQSQIEHTIIANGPFFDWGLKTGFTGFDLANHKAKMYGDGQRKINFTTLRGVGEAVVGVLSNPAPFTNRYLLVHDFYVNQLEVKEAIEELTGKPFTVENVDPDELEQTTSAALARGEFTMPNVYGLIVAYIYSNNSLAAWGAEDDTAVVGLSKKDLKAEIRKVLPAA